MRKARINNKWLSNCTSEELQQMNRLRFKGDSMMYEDVILAPFHRDKIRIFLLREGDKIVGWSSVLLPVTKSAYLKRPIYPTKPGTRLGPVYTYIKAACRKKGYGERLLLAGSKYAVSCNKSPIAFYHNDASRRFFDKVASSYPKLKREHIDKWWYLFPNWPWCDSILPYADSELWKVS